MIEKILEYQKLDTEIRNLEVKLENNPDQQAIDKLKNIAKDTQTLSSNLEKEAAKSLSDFENLQKKFNDALSSLSKIEQGKDSTFSEEQCADCVNNLNNISKYLSTLENHIMQLADKINKLWAEYQSASSNYKIAKSKHEQHKQKLLKLEEEILPKIANLKTTLSELEKGIPDNFLKKYKTKRLDKIFPVVVPLLGNACGGCGMELPSAQIEKLKKDGFLECENEHCHRIIYFA